MSLPDRSALALEVMTKTTPRRRFSSPGEEGRLLKKASPHARRCFAASRGVTSGHKADGRKRVSWGHVEIRKVHYTDEEVLEKLIHWKEVVERKRRKMAEAETARDGA